jgi:phosphoribosyl-ATP pyrophosphohydrolase/phosphoribosyl-AMP cyclohydrolase
MHDPVADSVASVSDAATLVYDADGLLPVVVQDVGTGAVLMVAFANQEAVTATLRTRQAHFFSRSRQQLWRKGETSGNDLDVVEVRTDCDRDTLLVRVDPRGPTCHLGTRTCFDPEPAALELGWLAQVVRARAEESAAGSYTARLLRDGIARVAQKVGEEGVECAIAALVENPEQPAARGRFVGEIADLLYHLVVLLEAKGVPPGEVAAELRRRHREKVSSLPGRNADNVSEDAS